ncbi:recombinase family protein [Leifsonia sp. H3M29-4]|nr:recombinase family protein [Salinibacterium metalliresistens]MDF1477746.1 recombinase family protein [Salinibacterium metalliresistens]
MNGQVVGYARVSSADQNLDRQLVALGDVDELFTDKLSGRDTNRPGLQALLVHIRGGDVVRVKSPDRLARSTADLLDLVEKIKSKGASVEFVDNPALNTDTPQGEFMLTILAAVAQMERAVIRERQAEGIAIAKKKGVYQKAPRLTDAQIDEARQRIEAKVPKAVVARDLGVSRTTLYTALAGEGVYAAT